MGHESQIEPWSPLSAVQLCWFRDRQASSLIADARVRFLQNPIFAAVAERVVAVHISQGSGPRVVRVVLIGAGLTCAEVRRVICRDVGKTGNVRKRRFDQLCGRAFALILRDTRRGVVRGSSWKGQLPDYDAGNGLWE